MGALIDLINENYSFSSDEIKGIALTSFILGFMFSFREWGIERFDLFYGLKNLISSILIVVLVLLFYISSQKIVAAIKGYKVEFKPWLYGLIGALVITFVSRGYLIIALAGTTMLYSLEGLRLGKFRFAFNYKDLCYISLIGPIAALLLAIIFKFIMLIQFQIILLKKALLISILFSFWNMIPIPPLDGSNVFFHSRVLWFFSFIAISVASLLLYFYTSILISVIAAIILGIVAALIWFVYVEKGF